MAEDGSRFGELAPRTPRNALSGIERTRRAIAELVNAEEAYVENLKLLVDKFLEPTKRLGNDVVPADKVNRIFGNVAAIANFHEILLNVLRQQRDKAPDNAEAMAAAFVAYADFLKLYTAYVNGYERCCDAVESLKDNRKFQDFLNKQRQDKACKGAHLMSFLIMPVQRIPQYEILFEDLIKAHQKQMQESGQPIRSTALESALEKVKEMAKLVNENKRRAETRSKMLDVASRLSGDDSFQLITPTRQLIREGDLLKLSTLRFKKVRKVFLFNDLLLWCTPSLRVRGHMDLAHAVLADGAPSASPSPQVTPQRTVAKRPSLDASASRSMADLISGSPSLKPPRPRRASSAGLVDEACAFEVVHPKKENPLILIAASPAEKDTWVRDIRRAIRDTLARESEGSARRRSLAPADEQQVASALAGALPLGDALAAAAAAAEQRRAKEGLTPASASNGGAAAVAAEEQPPEPPPDDSDEESSLPDQPSTSENVRSVLSESLHLGAVRALEQCVEVLEHLADSDMLALYNPDEDTHDSGDEAPDSPRNLYPPVVVRKVLEAVCIILGVEPVEVARGRASVKADYWKPAKGLVAKAHFLRLLKGHAQKRFPISPHNMNVLKVYITNPLLRPQRVSELSHVAGVLWNWVRASYASQAGHGADMVLQSGGPSVRLSEPDAAARPARASSGRKARAVSAKHKRARSLRASKDGEKKKGQAKAERKPAAKAPAAAGPPAAAAAAAAGAASPVHGPRK